MYKRQTGLVLPGLGTLQPSEIAKFAVVLVFAHIIALNHDRMGSFAVGVVPVSYTHLCHPHPREVQNNRYNGGVNK